MPRFLTSCIGMLAPCLILACADSPATLPAAPLSERALLAASPRSTITVNMKDACDPVSFDAAVGPGTCVRSGGMKFDHFISQLGRNGDVADWDFFPANFSANVGQTIGARNQGGEVHTFTEVAAFGGGIVPFLNQVSGNPVMAAECGELAGQDFVLPGTTVQANLTTPGTHRYQCCIHPWMRAVVTVE